MQSATRRELVWSFIAAVAVLLAGSRSTWAQVAQPRPVPKPPGAEGGASGSVPSSYDQIAPVLQGKQSFAAMMAKDKADKPGVLARHKKLLDERYDFTSHPDAKVTMSRGKPTQVGPAVKLPPGMTWQKLAATSPDEIREKGLLPPGFLPLPHPKHEAGGMLFPQHQIKQFERLARFDLDFDTAFPGGPARPHGIAFK